MCSIHIVADGYMLIILHEMAVPERGRKVDATVILGGSALNRFLFPVLRYPQEKPAVLCHGPR